MKVHWVNTPEGNPLGNHVGYSKANTRLKKALGDICELDEGANVAVHFLAPLWFSPIEGKKNVLFTMFESDDEDYYLDLHEGCDLIVTPSEFCRGIFERVTDVPIEVCNLGVDPKVFKYKKRHAPNDGEKFRWLFLGAPNARKYSILEDIHKVLFSRMPNVELYLKTTGADIAGGLKDIEHGHVQIEGDNEVVRSGNWVVDNRFLPTSELVELLHNSHAFISLHMGEGWGQNLLEAMCTGLPAVVSDYSATTEFANSKNSYPVPVVLEKTDVGIGKAQIDDLIQIEAARPNAYRAVDQIMSVMMDYRGALKKGKLAHRTASSKTWKRSAFKLKSILKRLDSPRCGQ